MKSACAMLSLLSTFQPSSRRLKATLRLRRRVPLRCTGNALNNRAVLIPVMVEVKK